MKSTPGATLYSGKDMDEGELHPIAIGLAAIFTHRAPDKSSINEDAAAIIPYDGHSGVLVVCDGVGGLPAGAKASEKAINMMKAALRESEKKQLPLRSAILDGIEKAHKEIAKLGVGAATTMAVAEIQKDYIRAYHVGDSQILLIGSRGKLKLMTTSHSPVGYAVEAGVIDDHEAMHHDERHLVSNLLGDRDMHIEIGPQMSMASKDTLIIASDGLFDNLHIKEIIETCRKGQLLSLTRSLIESCEKRMTAPAAGSPSKPDDLTFIAYRKRQSAA
jgi:PPM family protein phosphatase